MKVLTLNTHSWLEDDQEAKLKSDRTKKSQQEIMI